MLLLDPADVTLHLGKMTKYIENNGGTWRYWPTLADAFFNNFAVLFFVNRICMYPYLCWSAAFESQSVWREEISSDYGHGVAEWTAVVLLLILQVLQVFWFSIIARMAYNQLILGHETRDVRSDEDE